MEQNLPHTIYGPKLAHTISELKFLDAKRLGAFA